jgi:hypothetical protein
MMNFYPGDQGPFGEVGEPGALYAFAGTSSVTVDLNTFAYTAFSYQGSVTDLCAIAALVTLTYRSPEGGGSRGFCGGTGGTDGFLRIGRRERKAESLG